MQQAERSSSRDDVLMPRKTLALLSSFLSRYAALGADNMGLNDSLDTPPSSTTDSLASSCCTEQGKMVHDATCNLCDRNIVGTRYKCMQCQDWDCCASCNAVAAKLHPGHDLLRIDHAGILPEAQNTGVLHPNVYCDACDATIRGVRYKCITCPDFDLCANCEGHPLRPHKHHLFLKLDRPITVTKQMLAQSKAAAIDAAGCFPRTDDRSDHQETSSLAHISDQSDSNRGEDLAAGFSKCDFARPSSTTSRSTYCPDSDDSQEPLLNAAVVRDISFPDSSSVLAGSSFDKVWLVKNTGPQAWPAKVELRLVSQIGVKLFEDDDPRSLSGVVCRLEGNKLAPGAQTLVRVTAIKAPLSAGRTRCFFKLAAGTGRSFAFFGQQLWIDIDIVQHDSSGDSNEISTSSVLIAPSAPISAPVTEAGSEESATTSGHARRLAEWKSTRGVVHRSSSYAESTTTVSHPPTSATTESMAGSELAWDSESHLSFTDNEDNNHDDEDDFEHIDASL